ncbi:hypothetical protein DRO32_00980 [Candidatus Bathyarchaeota archaeon]|nr:MAG: hypothetical protein DRO32_00980 [Candidatus Bathyarchaeota archaeon]
MAERVRRVLNILSVDVEEFYHAFFLNRPPSLKAFRAHLGVKTILDLMEEAGARATFFMVGEVAEALPELVDALREDQEVGFHTRFHTRLWDMSPAQLREELRWFRRLVGDYIGFRAPMFSLVRKTAWALRELERAGLKYDSSLVPAYMGVYGVVGAPTRPYKPSEDLVGESEEARIWEFPLLVLDAGGVRLPCGGGVYLRALPLRLVRLAIRMANKKGSPAVVYVHPWETERACQVLEKIPLPYALILGMFKSGGVMLRKLRALLSEFKFVGFRDFMEEEGLL